MACWAFCSVKEALDATGTSWAYRSRCWSWRSSLYDKLPFSRASRRCILGRDHWPPSKYSTHLFWFINDPLYWSHPTIILYHKLFLISGLHLGNKRKPSNFTWPLFTFQNFLCFRGVVISASFFSSHQSWVICKIHLMVSSKPASKFVIRFLQPNFSRNLVES